MEKSMKTKIENNEKVLRKVDELGRITIEYERRKRLGIKEKDKFEIYLENNSIVLRKLNVLVEKKKILEEKHILNKNIEIDIQQYEINETFLDINDIGHHVRIIDELGRIVLPIELRKKLNIRENDKLEISNIGNNIILKKINKKRSKKHSSYYNKKVA